MGSQIDDFRVWNAFSCGFTFRAMYTLKRHNPEHNLVRARTQFRLVKEMEEQFEKKHEILKKYC